MNYPIDAGGYLVGAPCGCKACDTGAKHVICNQPPADLLQAERNGTIERVYIANAWHWRKATGKGYTEPIGWPQQ